MRTILPAVLLLCLPAGHAPVVTDNQAAQPASPEYRIWFDEPARSWNEAFPVGNGSLGAMVFGGVSTERIQLNEESLWCRGGRYENSNGEKVLDRIRELLFSGHYREAEELTRRELMSRRLPGGTNAYQTLGDIYIRYRDSGDYSGYGRALLLDSAIVRVKYKLAGTVFEREVFSTAVDDMIVFREKSSGDGTINCDLNLSRPGEGEVISLDGNRIIMKQHVEGGHGVRYEARLQVFTGGGRVYAEGRQLVVEDASWMEIRLAAATDYSGEDPAELCDAREKKASGRNFEEMLGDHVKEYQGYFHRVRLDLPGASQVHKPTDRRLELVGEGLEPGLAELYFNFGRYLLISSSRPGTLPANLQGIWNEYLYPPWNADYHININIQMNYWPSEITNLSECHLPFLYFIGELRESGRETARETYLCRGFVAHHTTDAWHQTELFGDPSWGMWPMGAAWASTHIWEHYLFTGDREFLADYGYGVMREAALFLSDFLVEHPVTGKLVSGPSISPENRFVTPLGDTAAISMGPAMDLQIIWHLFNACIEAAGLLDRDHEFAAKLQSQLEQLAPVQIGSDGRILEWSEEGLKEVEPGHRHMSHLYGLYPSPQYNWKDTPEYMEAASKVIEYRLRHGGGHTGWSRAWMINFYARLKDGEQAHYHLQQLLARSTLPNMFDNHPPFQIDGNFGGTAGIAEMLLQSHAGYVELLPALPAAWGSGRVSGLMARGGFEVDMAWEGEKITEVRVLSKLGNTCTLRYGDRQVSFETEKGEEIVLDHELVELD